jgi:acyl-CoA thioesterase II
VTDVEDPLRAADQEPGIRSLTGFLELIWLGDDQFEGPIPHYQDRPTLFGGQVAAQALRAAAHTVESALQPSSLHAYYLTAGARDVPLSITVERLRDGRSFATRRVEVVQHNQRVLTLEATFHRRETGPMRPAAMPQVPMPEALPSTPAPAGGVPAVPMEVRTPDEKPIPDTPHLAMWTRSLESWPDDPVLAACLLVYIADMRTGFASVSGLADWSSGMLSSLDHSVWFYGDIDPTDWLLVDMAPIVNGDGRGLVLGTIHDIAGKHAATFVQETLARPRRA